MSEDSSAVKKPTKKPKKEVVFIRLNAAVKRKLMTEAKLMRVSLNRWSSSLLAEAVEPRVPGENYASSAADSR